MVSLQNYLILMRLNRPIGILLLLWPTYWALWIAAGGEPKTSLLIIFTLGVIVMRSAGCVINDIFDRKFDANVSRTRNRPLALQKVSLKEAIIVFFLLVLVALILVWQLNFLTQKLACLAMIVAVFYPLLKRITHLPQLGLSVAFSCGIILAFSAEVNHVPGIAWLLFLANGLWILVYDTEYALADRADDLKIGVKSTAILFAEYDRRVLAYLQMATLVLLAGIGYWLHFGWIYYLCLSLGGVCFIYHQYLIARYDPEQCVKAFIHNQWFGCLVFIGIVLS